jgi:hypothetical protein
MCEPVTIVSLGLAAASAAVSYSQAASAAKAQSEYQEKLYSETAKQSLANYTRQIAQTQHRLDQERYATLDEGERNAIAAQQAIGQATAGMASTGLTGGTFDLLLADFARQEAVNVDNLKMNFGWKSTQAGEEMEGHKAEAQSRITSRTPGPVQQPSAAALALQIGAAGVSAYDQHSRIQRTGPYSPNESQNQSWMYRRLF